MCQLIEVLTEPLCYSANLASFLLQKENLDCKAKGLKQLSIYQGCANLQSPLVA